MASKKDYALNKIERTLSLSDESRTALSKLTSDELLKLERECTELHHNIRCKALNTARCPKNPAHGPHEFPGYGLEECRFCKVRAEK